MFLTLDPRTGPDDQQIRVLTITLRLLSTPKPCLDMSDALAGPVERAPGVVVAVLARVAYRVRVLVHFLVGLKHSPLLCLGWTTAGLDKLYTRWIEINAYIRP